LMQRVEHHAIWPEEMPSQSSRQTSQTIIGELPKQSLGYPEAEQPSPTISASPTAMAKAQQICFCQTPNLDSRVGALFDQYQGRERRSSLTMLLAIRLASSLESNLAADRRAGSLS